jgi:hypothetical protein
MQRHLITNHILRFCKTIGANPQVTEDFFFLFTLEDTSFFFFNANCKI